MNQLQDIALHVSLLKSDRYRGRLLAMEEICSSLMERGYPQWYLTEHGMRHVANVLRTVSETCRHLGRRLSEHEAFLLTSSALLHDVGMLPFRKGEVALIGDRAWQMAVRDQHAKRSAQFVGHFFPNLLRYPLTGEQIRHLQTMCAAHLKPSVAGVPEIEYVDGEPVRLRLLSALLRLGDVCDVTRRRNSLLFEVLPLPSPSFEKWAKMEFVSAVQVRRQGPLRLLEVNCSVPKTRVADFQALLGSIVLGKIESEFEDSKEHLQAQRGLQVTGVTMKVEGRAMGRSPMPPHYLEAMLAIIREGDRVLAELSATEKWLLGRILRVPAGAPNLASARGTSLKHVENLLAVLQQCKLVRQDPASGAFSVPLEMRARVRRALREE